MEEGGGGRGEDKSPPGTEDKQFKPYRHGDSAAMAPDTVLIS